MAGIRLEQVTKSFGSVKAVDGVTLEIADSEFLVLVGPSGCGKSTLLRMIAGLEEVTDGAIWIGDRDVTDLAPRSRDIAMVFQTYALYPHMTVRQNLGYGLKARRTPKPEIARRVSDVAALLGLTDLLERRPAQLSGGQRQRVAMGRAIAREPQAFLLDEPLPTSMRSSVSACVPRSHNSISGWLPTVYVTHDQTEAMTLGQRVAVMRDGRILQIDSPHELYARPRSLFVAAFIGSPAMNLVDATIDGDEVTFGQFRVALPRGLRPATSGDRVVLGIRPESFEDAAFAPGAADDRGRGRSGRGPRSDAHVFFHVDAPPITAEILEAAADSSLLTVDRALFAARVDPRSQAHPGRRLSLALDPSRCHFFDPESGERLAAAAAELQPAR